MFAVALGLAKSAHGATPDDHIATDDYIRRETEKSLDEVEHVFQLEQAPPPACTSAKHTRVPPTSSPGAHAVWWLQLKASLPGQHVGASTAGPSDARKAAALDGMSGEALRHLQTASSIGLSAEGAELFTGIGRGSSSRAEDVPAKPAGKVTWAALRPGHDFRMPGILEPDTPAVDAAAQRSSIWGAFHRGAVAGDLAGSNSAADRLSAAFLLVQEQSTPAASKEP